MFFKIYLFLTICSCISYSNQMCVKNSEETLYFMEIYCSDLGNSSGDKFTYTCDSPAKPINVITNGYDEQEYYDQVSDQFLAPKSDLKVVISTKNIKILHQDNLNFNDCKIEVLEISNGTIEKVIPGAFSKLKDLKKVDLSRNRIKYLSDGLFSSSQLNYINFNFNEIENISEHVFYGVDDLDYLDLSHNQLEVFHLPILELNKITTLVLSFNKISKLSLSANETYKIEHLDVSYNKLKCLSFLKFLDPFFLSSLRVSGNNITFLPLNIFAGFHHLSVLNISDNKLHHLQYGTFNYLDNLVLLDVSHNQLNSNDLHNFLVLQNLEKLYFNDNQIEKLEIENLSSHLIYISFYNNKFNFTCKALVKLIATLNSKSIASSYGLDFHDDNIRGIKCSKTANDTEYIEEESKDNNLTKFFSSINSKFSSLVNINQENNRISNNLLEELKRSKNKTKENLFGEKENIKSFFENLLEEFKQIRTSFYNTSQDILKKQTYGLKSEIAAYWNKDFTKSDFYKFFQNFKIQITNKTETNSIGVMEKLTSMHNSEYQESLNSISNQLTIVIVILIVVLLVYALKFKNIVFNQIFRKYNRTENNIEHSSVNLVPSPHEAYEM